MRLLSPIILMLISTSAFLQSASEAFVPASQALLASSSHHCHQSINIRTSSTIAHRFKRQSRISVNSNNISLKSTTTALQLQNTPSEDSEIAETIGKDCWSPGLRRVMGGIASLGVLETAFLTYNKFFSTTNQLPFCTGEGGSCSDVLNSPYAQVPFTDIPLSAMGFLAYLTVAGLSLGPLISKTSQDDSNNRMLLMGVTTAMGTFSIFLLTLLFGVLHQDCPYCELSATFSILLALIASIGGCIPEEDRELAQKGAQMTASGFLTSTVFAISLFVFTEDPTAASAVGNFGSTTPSTLLASSSEQKNAPPPITNKSSDRAMSLATDLEALDAKMFGAFWCSHCYDQKEALGKQAFSKIPYIECSKDGFNSETKLCKSKEVPGYPTWEINGKLYPGEQSIEELEEVVAEVKKGMVTQ